MKRRAQLVGLGLILLLLVNSLCFVECLCDEDKDKDKKVTAAVAAPTLAPAPTPAFLTAPAPSSLQQRLQRSSESATAGRFPVFPFRTAAGVLDSTLQGKVRVIEKKAPIPTRKSVSLQESKSNSTTGPDPTPKNKLSAFSVESDSTLLASEENELKKLNLQSNSTDDPALVPTIRSPAARARSIEFTTQDTGAGSDVNLLPASDEPFLEDEEDSKFQLQRRARFPARDHEGDDEHDGADEMQTPAESSSVFSGSKFQSLTSAIRNLKAISVAKARSTGTNYKYRPTGGGGSVYGASRPTVTSSTVAVGPTTVPIIGTGGGGDSNGGGAVGGFGGDDDGGTIPPFPSGGSSSGRPRPTTSPTSSSAFGSLGGSGSTGSGQIVPILTPGARRSQSRTGFGSSSRFDVNFDEDLRQDQDKDYDDEEDLRVLEEAVAPATRPSLLPLRAATTPTSLRSVGGGGGVGVGRAGRTRTRIVGVGFNPTTTASSRVGTATSVSAAAAVKPIRRLTIGGTVPSATATSRRVGVSSSSLLSRLRASTADVRSVNVDDDGGDGDIIRDFAFSDIRCFRTRSREYFGLTIHAQPGAQAAPYIRSRPQDSLTSSSCRLESTSSSMHMTITDLKACGVETCADNQLCLTLVFPRVPTLAMAEDQVTTVKCTPQQQQISQVTSISFQGDSLDQRRSSSTVDGGEQQFAAEVGVFRQSPGSNGLYVKRVTSGGAVKLGEPLQLRSVVRGGDGWAYSRLTDVQVWRMKAGYRHTRDSLNPSDAAEVLTLVDTRGCRNPEYKLIADSHPVRDPRNDLVYHFGFSAFLFRGQGASEPLIVTARVVACQEEEFCGAPECDDSAGQGRALDVDVDDEEFLKDQPAAEASSVPATNVTDTDTPNEAGPAQPTPEGASPRRLRRSPAPVEVTNMSRIVHDWNQQIALRVVGPGEEALTDTEAEDYHEEDSAGFGWSKSKAPPPGCTGRLVGATLLGAFVMLVCCAVALGAVVVCRGRGCRRLRFGGPAREEDEEQFEFRKAAPRQSRSSSSTRASAGRIARRQENQQQQNEAGAGPRKKQPNLPPLPPIPGTREEPTRGGRGHSGRGRARGKQVLDEVSRDLNNNQGSASEYECIAHQRQHQQEEEDDSRSCSSSGDGSVGGSEEVEHEDEHRRGRDLNNRKRGEEGRQSSRSQSRSRSRTREKDCYIVYYCGGGGKKAAVRSTSAPPSLRRRALKGRPGVGAGQSSKASAFEECIAAAAKAAAAAEEEEEEEEEDSPGWGAHSRVRRTVRSVKAARRSKGKGCGGSGAAVAGGSFPIRRTTQAQVSVAAGPPPTALKPKRSQAQVLARAGLQQHQQEDTSSDSAYSGSTSATTTVKPPIRGHGGGGSSGSISGPDDSVSSSLTHFVTRNEGGTQILIIPETNV